MEFAELDKMDAVEMRKEINSIVRIIRVLEWDKSRQQINPAKLSKLQELKKRYDELQSKLSPDQRANATL
jgi:predicted nuclease with TOPRIM domain